MKNSLISVITLTFNNFEGLIPTINSVLKQDYPCIEYIISDDGSDFFPKETVLSHIENNKRKNISDFKLFLNPQNVGTVKHLNNAIKKCNGEYIIILPGNDFFANDSIVSNIVKIFEEEDSDIVISGRATYIDKKVDKIIPHVKERYKIKKLDNNLKMYSALMLSQHFEMFIGVNTFYRKSSLIEIGYFDENYFLLEDIPILEKMLWDKKVSLKPDFISVFYDGKYGVSSRLNKNKLLQKDINYYNQFGRIKHFDELNKNTQKHIQFGIKREEAKNKFTVFLLCFVYLPNIINYLYYNFSRKLASFGDIKYIRGNNLNEELARIKEEQI